MSSQSELVELQETLYTSKNPTRRWLHCTRRDWIVDALHRTAAAGRERAVEVGPGSGIYLPTLARLYPEVVAADVEDAYLGHAKRLSGEYPNIALIADDITNSRLQSHSFDLVLCTEVVEHISDSQSALSEIHRILRPGGILVLSTPQRYSPLELTAKIAFLPGVIKLVRAVYREPVLETGHINLMSDKEITRQIQHAGFDIQERHKSGMYLPLIAEFLGRRGLHMEQWLEGKVRGRLLDGLLWTQYYIAKA